MAELTKISMGYTKQMAPVEPIPEAQEDGEPEPPKVKRPTEHIGSLFSKILKKKK